MQEGGEGGTGGGGGEAASCLEEEARRAPLHLPSSLPPPIPLPLPIPLLKKPHSIPYTKKPFAIPCLAKMFLLIPCAKITKTNANSVFIRLPESKSENSISSMKSHHWCDLILKYFHGGHEFLKTLFLQLERKPTKSSVLKIKPIAWRGIRTSPSKMSSLKNSGLHTKFRDSPVGLLSTELGTSPSKISSFKKSGLHTKFPYSLVGLLSTFAASTDVTCHLW